MINASGDCSGAESVMLDHVGLTVAEGVEVVVASPPGPLVGRLPDGVRHLPLPPFGLGGSRGRVARATAAGRLVVRTALTARALRREVRRPGTHTVVNSLLALPAVRLARPRTPAAWLVHDVVTSADQRRFVRFGAPALGLVVAVSEATAAPLRSLGCDVVVRPNGVEWPAEPVDLVRHDPPVVGSAAALAGWKGQGVLLEAVAGLPGVRCELAGGTFADHLAYARSLEARAAAADLSGRVALLGHVDAMAAMRTWDVAVLASTSPEAGPLAVLEAMSIGLPVVATDHGGSAELLTGGCGILVPPGDVAALRAGIEAALDDDRRSALAAAARERVAARYDRSVTLPAQHRAVVHGER